MHRRVRADCPTVDDARLQSRRQIHGCLAFLYDRRFFRPVCRIFSGRRAFRQEILGMCIIILSGILSSIRPTALETAAAILFRQR